MKKTAMIVVVAIFALFVVLPALERGNFLADNAGKDVKTAKFYVLHPNIIVFSGVSNLPPLMFDKDSDNGKVEFHLVLYDKEVGVAAFLSDRSLRLTRDKSVPVLVQKAVVAVMNNLIRERIENSKIFFEKLMREKDLERGQEKGRQDSSPASWTKGVEIDI